MMYKEPLAANVSHHVIPDLTAVWGADHPRTEWFDVRQLEPGVWLIAEPGHVNSFLIEGNDLAVLMDTGLGVANIRSIVEGLSTKPILVVNSHHHFDHSGGNLLFDDVAIHRAGQQLLAEEPPDGLAAGYMDYVERLLSAWRDYKAADDVYFHLVTRETLLRPLPDGFDRANYVIRPSNPSRLLDDEEVIDLGGRSLRILHTPGHSPDSICLFDEANGLLFGGDTVNTGPIYAQLEGSDVNEFAASSARLAGLRSSVDRVFVCHFMRVENTPELLFEIAQGFERIVDGSVSYRDNVDCLNYPVKEACFDHFSVFVPPQAGRPRV